jgi:SAM-dependent methyltransferase
MHPEVRQQFETFPDPSPATVPIDAHQLDRLDDNLHYGWSWHRHRYCYRRPDGLRILDAGCGTGLTTLGLARLNPGSSVLGLDASPRALGLARQRAETTGAQGVQFQEHDLEAALPPGLGPFDFIVCRRVLGQAEAPGRLVEHLARALDDRGLLLLTAPAREGRQAVRLMRQAVLALAPADADLAERARIGVELFQALRPDHPIRQYEARFSGVLGPSPERFVAGYLNEAEREWSLAEAVHLLEGAGLKFLYAAAGHPWQPERVFGANVPEALKARVADLPERDQALLIDALDPTMHLDEYRIYACPADFEPRLPSWPEERTKDPEAFERLIPHPTGLVAPANLRPDPASVRGRVSYRVITGMVGEIEHRSDLLLRAVDGRRTCGEIDRALYDQTKVAEDVAVRQGRWLELANHGFVLLESPDPRQHVDCVYLGPIRDRLDCPCPRRWVRGCERHGLCTIDEVRPDDAQAASLAQALARLGVTSVISCARCPDYTADE